MRTAVKFLCGAGIVVVGVYVFEILDGRKTEATLDSKSTAASSEMANVTKVTSSETGQESHTDVHKHTTALDTTHGKEKAPILTSLSDIELLQKLSALRQLKDTPNIQSQKKLLKAQCEQRGVAY